MAADPMQCKGSIEFQGSSTLGAGFIAEQIIVRDLIWAQIQSGL